MQKLAGWASQPLGLTVIVEKAIYRQLAAPGTLVYSVAHGKNAELTGRNAMKRLIVVVVAVFCLCAAAVTAQTVSHESKTLLVWNVHAFEMGYQPTEQRTTYILGVLTPEKPITIRRVEAISNSGPKDDPPRHGFQAPPVEPVPCRAQYSIEITNGVVTHNIPISNIFIQKKSSQTFTDSGPLKLFFAPQSRITVSVIAPKPQFPPVYCGLSGLNISIQYEPSEILPNEQASAILKY